MVQLTVEHPERVSKLFMHSFSPCPLPRPDWPYSVPLDVVTAIQEEVAAPGESRAPQDITSLLTEAAASDPDLTHWFEESGRVGPKTAEAYIAATLQTDVRPLLGRITVPTLILHSTRDRWAPVEGARFCADQIPDARLVEFDSGDSLPFTHLLDERLAEIEAFVEGDTPIADEAAADDRAVHRRRGLH